MDLGGDCCGDGGQRKLVRPVAQNGGAKPKRCGPGRGQGRTEGAVRFPGVRESLSARTWCAEMAKEKDNPFAGPGTAFASTVSDARIGATHLSRRHRSDGSEREAEGPRSTGKASPKVSIAFIARPRGTGGEKAPPLIF